MARWSDIEWCSAAIFAFSLHPASSAVLGFFGVVFATTQASRTASAWHHQQLNVRCVVYALHRAGIFCPEHFRSSGMRMFGGWRNHHAR